MEYINFKKEKPPFYTPILCELTTGTHVVAWRAVGDDDKDIYTINLTDDIIQHNRMLNKWTLIAPSKVKNK